MGQVIILGAILVAIILTMGLVAMDRHEYRLALKKIEKEAEESRENFRLQTIELWQKALIQSYEFSYESEKMGLQLMKRMLDTLDKAIELQSLTAIPDPSDSPANTSDTLEEGV